MHIIEQTFCRIEYDKFVLQQFEKLPQDRENELKEIIQKLGERAHREQHYKRLAALKSTPSKADIHSYYFQVHGIRGVRRYDTSNGNTVYRLPVKSFNLNEVWAHYTNCYLVIGKELTLIDCGMSSSEPCFAECFRILNQCFGEKVALNDIQNIVVTHAHIDHYGGLAFLYPQCKPRLYVHEDDAWTIENVKEVGTKTKETISKFLTYTGLPSKELEELQNMYTLGKKVGDGWHVSDQVRDGDRIIDDFEVVHVPGHCPGQINLLVGDLVFLGDQILMGISPHQFPRFYRKGMGLVHYLPSLLKITSRLQKVRLGLAAHNEEIADVRGRAMEIVCEHHNRLADLLSLLDRPKTLHELTTQYYTEIHVRPLVGYDRILALEEIEAHMEYLDGAMNYVEAVQEESEGQSVFRYRRR